MNSRCNLKLSQRNLVVKYRQLRKPRVFLILPLDKRTNVLYNDICDFVALCGKATKTEYRCQHIERAIRPTTRRQANVITAHIPFALDHGLGCKP